jgi:hypothetical protein
MVKASRDGKVRQAVNTRIRPDLRDALQREANAAGRTLSAEIEYRLEASFRAQDLTTMLREEMRALIRGANGE